MIGRGMLAVTAILVAAQAAFAATYKVGPGQKYTKVGDVAGTLAPGDIVEITGDIEEPFMLTKDGTWGAPVTIRGVTSVKDGRIIRPKVKLDGAKVISCRGSWNVIEGLDISGAQVNRNTEGAISQDCWDLVIRNCRIHNNNQAIGISQGSGNTTVEMCEIDSNGGGHSGTSYSGGSAIYAHSRQPGTLLKIENCYFHDGTGGYFIRSRNPRNLIRCNWFEGPYHSALKIINELGFRGETTNLRPMHTDIVGNVFDQGTSPGPKYDVLQLGAEGEETPGTEGDFHVAHNLFVMTAKNTVALRVNGNVDRLRTFNNVFLGVGIGKYKLYERGPVWENERREAFKRKRAGNGEPIIEGANNWISADALDVPSEFKDTIRGGNPKLVDPLKSDFRPRADSPLAGAGMYPLPQGQIADLTPEFEPRRGIPADLKPVPRRKAEKPAVGPFETAK